MSTPSVRQILKTAKWKCYMPSLFHAMTGDDPDHRLEFCEWVQREMGEEAQFLGAIVWTDEETFKLNGTMKRHNYVHWSSENSKVNVDKAMNSLRLSLVWCVI
jgi:hypothetical protein